jgi:hypothetical protein
MLVGIDKLSTQILFSWAWCRVYFNHQSNLHQQKRPGNFLDFKVNSYRIAIEDSVIQILDKPGTMVQSTTNYALDDEFDFDSPYWDNIPDELWEGLNSEYIRSFYGVGLLD